MMLHPIFIDDENEVDEKLSSSDEEEGEDDDVTRVRKRRKRGIDPDFVDGFVFDVTEETKVTVDNLEGLGRYLKKTVAVSLDEKIARVRRERRIEQPDLQLPDEPDQELSHVTDRVNEKKRNKSVVDQSFFESSVADANYGMTFSEMNLSRPILKAISACGFTSPTPIQAACIPLALAGRDICACASTGTGKTAAFMLPILERLLYKPRRQAVSRVLVLVPTRELAIQVFQVPPFNK